MSYLDFPLRIDGRGRAALTGSDDHVRHMIEMVLFTRPGERVNLPDFGCGLQHLVFTPANEMLATTTQFLVHGALHRWLGDIIDVASVRVTTQDAQLLITVSYRRKDTGEASVDQFTAPGVGQ